MTFKKGHKTWNKGKKYEELVGEERAKNFKKRLSELRKGKKLSEEQKSIIIKRNGGKYFSDTTLKKMSLYRQGKTYDELYGKEKARIIRDKHSKDMSGENNSFFNKKHSDKTKGEMSEKRKKGIADGKIIVLNGKNHYMFGKLHSKEFKEKVSLSLMGEKNPFFGKHHSQQTREKNRAFQLTFLRNNPEQLEILKERGRKAISPKRDTSIERKIQDFLSRLHIEYTAHKHISGISRAYCCDIFIPVQPGITQKTIMECDGCYWHGCPTCKCPPYRNLERRKEIDTKRTSELINQGYRVIRLWEHEIRAMRLNKFKGIAYC